MSKLFAMRLPDDLFDRLHLFAKTQGLGASEVARGFIEAGLPDAAPSPKPIVPRRPSGGARVIAALQDARDGKIARSKAVVASPAKRVQVDAPKPALHVEVQVGRTKPSPGSLLKSKGKTK